ncbi:hypothetical protein [Halocola ammonii]
MRIRLHTFLLLSLFLISFGAEAQFYTGSQQEFGKNRVQYRDFNWLHYDHDQFEVYHYRGGDELAQYVLRSAIKNQRELESFFDYTLNDKIQIIVYNKQSEFRQSNIGLGQENETNIGGSTRIVGSKMFVYYEGSHEKLNDQIRKGLAEVLFSQMMYGGDWKDMLKNSTLLTIPNWFKEGIISYATEEWSVEAGSYIRDGVLTGKFEKFNRLEDKEARYAGHALWKYIADVYGENVIPNILYMTRISRNAESGYLYVLGLSLSSLTEEFLEYYRNRFREEQRQLSMPEYDRLYSDKTEEKLEEWESLPEKRQQRKLARLERRMDKRMGALPVKFKDKYTYSEFAMSPDGEKVAFTTNQMGQYKIWIYDIESGKLDKILKREYKLRRIIDDSYPIITWHPQAPVLTYIFEDKGRVFLGNYNLEEKEETIKELFRIDKVVSFEYSPSGRQMVFSGVHEGQTDIYLYQVIGNNQSKLTDDVYDDLQPSFLPEGDKVIFASNRPGVQPVEEDVDGLFPLEKDIYVMEISSRDLTRITDTPEVNESQPYAYDDENYTFLSDANDFQNRYIARIDSAISRVDTTIHYRYFTVKNPLSKYSRNILEYDFQSDDGDYTMVFYKDGKPMFVKKNKETDRIYSGDSPGSGDTQSRIESENVLIFKEDTARQELEIDIRNYEFQDDKRDYEFEKETIRLEEITEDAKAKSDTTDQEPEPEPWEFEMPQSQNYRLNFATDYVISQVDNTFANQFYQPYTSPTTVFPGISGLIKLGISDLFEDYKIIGGFRLSGNLDNNDYGVSFQDLSGRIDKQYTFQRQGQRRVTQASVLQYHTHMFEYELSYPFDELTSLRGTAILRNDRTTALSVDPASLAQPNMNTYNVGVRLAFVFDNTLSKGLNLYNGTRFKAFAEYYREPTDPDTDMKVLGFDFRHYEPIHRDLIAAFRLAGNTSFGTRRIVHYLGGVDNWLFQEVEDDTDIDEDQNYFFQTLASPMRGFLVNARNGNSFMVANAEIRWPVFKYFLNKPIKSDFVENFQIVAFGDAGTAWTGPGPYSDENTFNRKEYESNPITVIVDNNREPVVFGYGFGLRSRILGYFVRVDWAWGIDDGVVLPREFYLSLNLDF